MGWLVSKRGAGMAIRRSCRRAAGPSRGSARSLIRCECGSGWGEAALGRQAQRFFCAEWAAEGAGRFGQQGRLDGGGGCGAGYAAQAVAVIESGGGRSARLALGALECRSGSPRRRVLVGRRVRLIRLRRNDERVGSSGRWAVEWTGVARRRVLPVVHWESIWVVFRKSVVFRICRRRASGR
jgi:hypothetical protein